MDANERATAWAIDQLDPDNWLRIPDFGINPQEVDFEGFAFPIVGPSARNYWLCHVLREHVRTARALIRREKFISLPEISSSQLRLLDRLEVAPPNEKLAVSHRSMMAVRYLWVMEDAERVDRLLSKGRQVSSRLSHMSIAHLASNIRELTLLALDGEKEFVEIAVDEAMARHVADRKRTLSEAGKDGAREKHRPIAALKTWALEKAAGNQRSDAEIARELSALLPHHLADVSKDPERLIYDTLRARPKAK